MGFTDDALAILMCPPVKWAIIILVLIGAAAPFFGPVVNGILNAPILPFDLPTVTPEPFEPDLNVTVTPSPTPAPTPSPSPRPTLPGTWIEPSAVPGGSSALAHVAPVTSEERSRCLPVNDTRVIRSSATAFIDPGVWGAVAYHRGDVVPLSLTFVNLEERIMYTDVLSVTFRKKIGEEWLEYPFKYNVSVRWAPRPLGRESHDLLVPIPDVDGLQGFWQIDLVIIDSETGEPAVEIIKEVNIL